MKYIISPKNSPNTLAYQQVEALEISLGGCFYDYLRCPDGKIVGVKYWLMEPVNFEQHPVYSQFLGDDRLIFDIAGDYVDIVFDESNAELLQKGQLTVDVVQEFGGEGVLKCGEWFAMVFLLVE